ncbi:uncharacterized protein LOC103010024 [Balaenoptera acutorostrata]|uniref:Uncharacterized protein LOC103010024 n=1 Tax=Balaenoptera acutorostrata TaxID=9767 RepID=A0ABM3T7E6_BALAC|nr:uncharacterized protein LOC103010024 [Balaenoptera acutorostrata]
MHLVGQHLPYCRGERTQITMSSLPDLHDVDITNYVSMLYLETKVSQDWGTAQPQFLKQYHDDVHLSQKCRIAPISSKIIYRGYNQKTLTFVLSEQFQYPGRNKIMCTPGGAWLQDDQEAVGLSLSSQEDTSAGNKVSLVPPAGEATVASAEQLQDPVLPCRSIPRT